MVARGLDIPVVLTIHQLPQYVSFSIPDLPAALTHRIESSLWAYSNWLLRQCTQVIVPSHTIANEVHDHGPPRPTVISNGVDLRHFNPLPASPEERRVLCGKYGLDPELPIILHVGRLDTDKRVNLVIHTAARVLRQMEAQLLVVGDGCQRKALIQLSQSLGIGPYSRYPGMVPMDGDLPGLYRLADVFAMASEIETQGLVILEAMASGLPVVAVRATCIPEVVRDSVNGYLAEPGNVGEMAHRLVRVLRYPRHAKEMGQAGRSLVREHAVEHSFDVHELLYEGILKPGGKVVGGRQMKKSAPTGQRQESFLDMNHYSRPNNCSSGIWTGKKRI